MDPTEPSELVLLIVKIGFLALLWGFVLVAVRAVRLDMFGPTKRQQRRGPPPMARPTPPSPPPQPVHKPRSPSKLVVTKGHLAGTTIPLGSSPVTIGRAQDSTLVLEDDFASGRHARLVPHDGQWFVEDLGSTNGTYLNRTKVTSPMPVPLGAPVRIGKTVLELHR
ncbi:FHA domain-containing protein FhaB [Frankia canadensis]|uniref:FHA domain-containing protein FhaB n=1 Tax=Frankia canadensis TaxID=1836972 RepID=A0A2I2KRK3_9ACTN|nr:FHA domain-containing protein [Frankia canadensis]SNQ48295.1 FHA domain-containing protein FhaB [Frankia canadensis]SOU55585.1 FHA domain-containing protein FhaB [Frankia canadensis]